MGNLMLAFRFLQVLPIPPSPCLDYDIEEALFENLGTPLEERACLYLGNLMDNHVRLITHPSLQVFLADLKGSV